ncbi:MAG: hypothetical protein GX811_05605 [Lentisphaerae bacterium]|nr:hypothetical protein [Lentisphaerota bacterium]
MCRRKLVPGQSSKGALVLGMTKRKRVIPIEQEVFHEGFNKKYKKEIRAYTTVTIRSACGSLHLNTDDRGGSVRCSAISVNIKRKGKAIKMLRTR